MEEKDLVPIVVAVIATVTSLVLAALNFRASKKMDTIKRTYSLVGKDLEKLEKINEEFTKISLPSDQRIMEVLSDEENQKAEFQKIFDELQPQYKEASVLILANNAIFDSDIQEANKQLISQVEGSRTGGEEIGYRMQALIGFLKNVQKQIKKNRDKLAGNS
ncbi:MAG: hypothetical protein FH754_03940 [Marinobacter sp.]|nr:hypothetical protein [Marinobacter sp.]